MTSRKADYSPEAWERHKQRERDRGERKYADPEWRRRLLAKKYALVKERRAFLDAIRRERGCLDCGTKTGRLDFDHRDGETKLFNLAHPRTTMERILVEMAKCDVRCASCHARRHVLQNGGVGRSRPG